MTSQTGQMQKVPDFYLQSITEILPSVLLHHTNPKSLVLLIRGACAPGGGPSCWHGGRAWTRNARSRSLDPFSLWPIPPQTKSPLTPSPAAPSEFISFSLLPVQGMHFFLEHWERDFSVFKVSHVIPFLIIFVFLLKLKFLLGSSSIKTRDLSNYRSL